MSRTGKTRWIFGTALFALLITVLFLIYRNHQLNENLNAMKEAQSQDAKVIDPQAEIFSRADSLLLVGEYLAAIDLYGTLSGSEAEMKTALAERLVELRQEVVRKSQSIEDLLKRDTTAYNRSELTSLRAYDSLSFALEKAKMQLNSIKAQLKTKNFGEYITFTSSKGNRLHYVGQVKNGKANGQGIAILDSGSRYEGEWKDNKRHGEGAFYWIDGERYVGSYENDYRSGFGIYYWPNGERFEGYWEKDERNGRGTFYGSDGDVVTSGIWVDDELVEEYE